MGYKEHLKRQAEKKQERKERVNSSQVRQSVVKVLKFLGKVGLNIVKFTFNIVKHGVNIMFWVGSEAVKWVAYTLEIVFAKADDKYRKSTNYKARKVIVGAVVAFLVVGGTITGLKVKGLSNENEELKTALEQEITTVNAKTNNKDTSKGVEVEITEDNSKDKKDVEKEALAKKEADTKKAENAEKALANKASNIEKPKFVGEMGIKSEIGTVDPGYMGTTEVRYADDKGQVIVEKVDEYGIGQFTSSPKKRFVGHFMKYLSETDANFYKEYFEGVGEPGTTTFTTGWYSASKYEAEKFKELQYNYVFDKYVAPTVVAVKDKFNIDLMSSNAYQEFAYSTANQYDVKGTIILFEKANITSEMSEKEVIEAVQKEKIDSLGKYTYTDKWSYNDAWRNGVKVRAEKELTALLGMIK